jgi:hypothetical protein
MVHRVKNGTACDGISRRFELCEVFFLTLGKGAYLGDNDRFEGVFLAFLTILATTKEITHSVIIFVF